MTRRKNSRERIEPSFEKKRAAKSGRPAAADRSRKRAKGRKRSATRSGGRLGRWLRGLVYWCFVLGIWGAIGVGGIVVYYGARMPNASTWSIPDRPPNVRIVSVRGELLANRGVTGGQALSLGEMSPYIPQAVMAIEDRRFYSHFGVDPFGLLRAVIANIKAGHTVQGGSTLTQQLAKNLFLSPERTLERKVQEVLLAFWLEHKFTKDQILEMYLNRVYFGSGAYGVAAASRRYFNKPARDVSIAEAALLAGLLKAPSRLSPANDPEAADARAQVVLGAMADAGFITDRQTARALTASPIRPKSYWTGSENYVADMVMERLPGLIGKIEDDIVVDTTIDFFLQREAEKAIREAIDENGEKFRISQGALVSLDGTGAIRALVGGVDYSESQYNRASLAKRQPGSAFKPFVYTAALELGRTPASVRNDAPVRIGKWTPENYNNKYRGPVTLADALAFSLNTIAAQLVMEVGPKEVVKVAHRLGIQSELHANASIALGTSEVTLSELTAAYAPFMNGGYKATPHLIKRVSTLNGEVLYENTYDNPPKVLEPAVLAMMNRMLVGVIEYGTGKRARLDKWQAAGKTGTTQSYRDALFVGYTANLTTGVWFGNDDGTPMKRVTGGGLPARTWKTFMQAAHEGIPAAPLPYADFIIPPAAIGEGAPVAAAEPQPAPDLAPDRAPVSGAGNRALERAQRMPARRQQGGPVPPAEIGDAGGDGSGGGQDGQHTTLLDIILGN